MILAGDIGGTNTRLALFRLDGERLALVAERTYPSRSYAGLDPIVREFASRDAPRVEHACFGIAGPVVDGRSATTNLPWVVDARRLAGDLRLASVGLINDLEANAYGIAALEARDFAVLHAGAAGETAVVGAAGHAAILSAGTGLGEAGLYWDGERHHPFASEGGHASFAPVGDLQIELLRHLARSHPHVSWERVLSGPGLYNIYAFLRDTGRGEEPPWLFEQMREGDPSAIISGAALAGRSALCDQALDLFVVLYGAEAGNLALKFKATGGVYVGGGIAPKIIERLGQPPFVSAFLDKGRMRALLERIPVKVILNTRTALLGAARCAALRDGLMAAGAGRRDA
jgi:glucokinase